MYVGEGILRGVSIEAEEEAEVDRYVRYMLGMLGMAWQYLS